MTSAPSISMRVLLLRLITRDSNDKHFTLMLDEHKKINGMLAITSHENHARIAFPKSPTVSFRRNKTLKKRKNRALLTLRRSQKHYERFSNNIL